MIAIKKLASLAICTACSISFGWLTTPQSAFAQASERQSNNTFTTRESLPTKSTSVEGVIGLDKISFGFRFLESLSPGEVDSFRIPNLTPFRGFLAQIDNSSSGVDTILGSFDENGNLITFDDDSGMGVASALGGSVNPDGTLNLRVTGYADFSLSNNHSQSGDYKLSVLMGDYVEGDVDFFSFSNLLGGSPFTAQITFGGFDSILGWFDDDGNLITADDDSGEGVLSLINGIVPRSGNLIFGVTGFEDFDINGGHLEVGSYTLSLEVNSTSQSVPEPTSVLGLVGVGMMGVGAKLKRKTKT
ncbi:MAG TPA: VPLPA-CTERM sorting domain-containing protein [Cyanobacteria bacterium UBA12227]|nr:VPLPA-CTERM sorting domain-containing protein [Cyanobacteria bacterium UBA12227]HAX90023.1 VPLPA-CTERM sorting domain-containing protein [Cyanobacteria bacterium UBA11370]